MDGAFALIDLSAFEHNAMELRKRLGEFYCVLKCDAYGHGAEKCASRLAAFGMKRFAVYSLSEAETIRKTVSDSEILILGRTDPALCGEIEADGFIQTVGSAEYAEALAKRGKGVKVHIEIDCGMNRWGFKPQALEEWKMPFSKENVTGAFAHLSCADEKDISEAKKQISAFNTAADAFEARFGKTLTRHISASAGSLRKELGTNALSRVGLALYGIVPENCDGSFLRPVMSFYSQVTGVRKVKNGENVGYGVDHRVSRDSVIATVSGGYANGIHRSGSGRLAVIVGGERAGSVGNICMDRFMVDVTDMVERGKSVREGDEVTFFDGTYGVGNMARECGTIPYEILTSVGRQNRRIYLSSFKG